MTQEPSSEEDMILASARNTDGNTLINKNDASDNIENDRNINNNDHKIKGEQKKMSLFEISILSDLLNQIFPAFSPYFITMICNIKFRPLFDP